MKFTQSWASAVLVSAMCATGWAQSTTTTTTTTTRARIPAHTRVTTKKKTVTTHKRKAVRRPVRHEATEEQLREVRTEMQQQIDTLRSQIATKDQQIVSAQQNASDAAQQAVTATSQAQQAAAAAASSSTQVQVLQSRQDDLKANVGNLQETVVQNQAQVQQEINEPLAFHYKGITITPVAFFAFEGVYRQRATNSGINTPFNSIPFPGSSEGHVSELNFSGRQSRLGGLFEGNAGAYKLSGYFEADFLSAGTTSNSNQSNSYTLRQRQIWGKAETKGGFAVAGGQMWSLVTEDGQGTNNRTEKLPATIDSQYVVGYNWARQPAIRFQQRFGDYKTGAMTLAMSLENAQTTGFTVAGPVPANSFFAGPGTGGGLYNSGNNYTLNVAPDIIVKAAFDSPRSKFHGEVGGLASFFRTVYFPATITGGTAAAPTYTLAANEQKNTKTGGGVFGTVRVSPSKYFDTALQVMAGQGVGRYGSAQLADATLRPDGTLEPLRNYHGLYSLETHPNKKLDVFAYYGGEYAQRTVYLTATGAQVGYGTRNTNDAGCYALPANPGQNAAAPSTPNCGSPTRYIQEGVIGFTYRVVNSPKYGRLQYQGTYSYLQRNAWSGVGNAVTPSGPRALENQVHFGMRYYIP